MQGTLSKGRKRKSSDYGGLLPDYECVRRMGRRDRQHYVSQGYLRNFSPDRSTYQNQKDTLDDRRRKQIKERMRIHFYDIDKHSCGFARIASLAWANRFLLPEADKIVRRTEDKLPLLGEVIQNRSEEFLHQDNHRESLIEIANCLAGRSLVFRNHAASFCASTRGDLKTESGDTWAQILYTREGAELLQTMYLTNKPEIIVPLMLRALRLVDSSDGSNATFQERLERKGIGEDELVASFRNKARPSIQSLLSSTLYPILIENNSESQFITGDVCVAKGEYHLPDLKATIPVFLFPISPELAILFLEEEKSKKDIPRVIDDKWIASTWNRHMYNCSIRYLFANSIEPLQQVTRLPRGFESTW